MVKSRKKKKTKSKTEKQTEQQDKLLKNIFIGLGIFILTALLIYGFIYYLNNFEYEGVKFKKVKFCDSGPPCLILYQTSLPVIYMGEEAEYNFYLRNDPRTLGNISFDEKLVFLRNVVINATEDFNCNGDGILAVANLVKLYQIVGTDIIKDENASCDPEGKYVFLQLQPGNQTNIEKFGPACYNLNINNCEILKVTERLMIEIFIEFNKLI